MKTFDWNVVINGFWNRAILTPNGIARRIFRLQEETLISVFVDVEGLKPTFVNYEHFNVTVDKKRLIINTKQNNFDDLEKILEYGRNAISSLPETPFQAAGFNVRYLFDVRESAYISEIIQTPIDRLSDQGYQFQSSGIYREIKFKEGQINLNATIRSGGDEMEFLLNFHRESSQKGDLEIWLRMPKNEIEAEVNKILSAFGLYSKQENDSV